LAEREEAEQRELAEKLRRFEEEADQEIGYIGIHPSQEFGTFRWASGNIYVGELKFGKKVKIIFRALS